MKQLLVFLISIVVFSAGSSQTLSNQNCQPLSDYNRYLWFNDNYNNLIDNGLRCFQLGSIANSSDSCIRIWIEEFDYPDSPYIHRLKLFELGTKGDKNYATYYTLEWVRENDLSVIKCITKQHLKPINRWYILKRKVYAEKLDKIQNILPSYCCTHTDGSLVMLQYVSDNKTITLDFSSKNLYSDIEDKRSKKFIQLIQLIKDEFSINISDDNRGTNFLLPSPRGVMTEVVENEILLDSLVPSDRFDSTAKKSKPEGFPKNYISSYLERMYDVDSISPFVNYEIDTTLYTVNDSVERDKRLDTLPLGMIYSIEYQEPKNHPEGIILLKTVGSQTPAEIKKLLVVAKSKFIDHYAKGIKTLSHTSDPALVVSELIPASKAKIVINKIRAEDILAIKIWDEPVNWKYLKKNRENGLVQLWLKQKHLK